MGKTQGASTVSARNAANRRTAVGAANATGSFRVVLPLADGKNAISVTATDPAGNAATVVLTVQRGTGKLKVTLTASASRISVKQLPSMLKLSAVATDPGGRSMAGRDITFMLLIPGVSPITVPETTNASGVAVFGTLIPAGATPGKGTGTAVLTTPEYGNASDPVEITITP